MTIVVISCNLNWLDMKLEENETSMWPVDSRQTSCCCPNPPKKQPTHWRDFLKSCQGSCRREIYRIIQIIWEVHGYMENFMIILHEHAWLVMIETICWIIECQVQGHWMAVIASYSIQQYDVLALWFYSEAICFGFPYRLAPLAWRGWIHPSKKLLTFTRRNMMSWFLFSH